MISCIASPSCRRDALGTLEKIASAAVLLGAVGALVYSAYLFRAVLGVAVF